MAIAPFEGHQEAAAPGIERRLRVIEGGRPAGAAPRRSAVHATDLHRDVPRGARASHPSAQRVPLRTESRRVASQPRAVKSVTARRRRAAGFGLAVVAASALTLPLHALGAVTVDGRLTPGGSPSGLAPGSTVVVQPGETIHSLALQVNAGDVAGVSRSLAAEVGSNTLVPGEHVVVP